MKKILVCFLIFFAVLGAKKQKPVLLFSAKPINPAEFSFHDSSVEFPAGKKFYFVLFNPEKYNCYVLRIQILKIDYKMPGYGGVSLVHGRDVEIDPENPYFTNSVVLYTPGDYIVRIFGVNDFFHPLAEQPFKLN